MRRKAAPKNPITRPALTALFAEDDTRGLAPCAAMRR
jgi:hypothetical protein